VSSFLKLSDTMRVSAKGGKSVPIAINNVVVVYENSVLISASRANKES